MRVIICGSRTFSDRTFAFEKLDKLLNGNKNIEKISGGADGADRIGEEYARSHGHVLKVFKANWGKYGKGAGPIRNMQMMQYALEDNPAIIAFWDGKSSGTKNMISIGKASGAKLHIIDIACTDDDSLKLAKQYNNADEEGKY